MGGFTDFLFGEDPSVEFMQSPQQRQMYQMALPWMEKMFSNSPQYQIPDAVAPTKDWYNSISPQVKQGMMAPYQDMSNQLTESLGYSSGSARGGASGMLGNAQSNFWSDAGKDYGMNLWNMTAPGLMNNWQAQLNRSIMPYQAATNIMPGTYSQPVVNQGSTGLIPGALTAGANMASMWGMNKLLG